MYDKGETRCNIHDWGELKTGDAVEYVRLHGLTASIDHGTTHITYKCSAYLELSNGDIVDGYCDTTGYMCMLIVGGKPIPAEPTRGVIKKTLKKLQSGGRGLAAPYQRIMGILGESVGLALKQDAGVWMYVESRAHKQANRTGASKAKSKPMPLFQMTQAEYDHPVRFTKTWKEQTRDSYLAYKRRKGEHEPLDPPVHWHDEHTDLRKVISGLGE
jgi:hypothetical protein